MDREPSYCGQSWLQVDSNNDGKVTQSEAHAAFAREFAEIDASGDDAISSDEYRECRTSQMAAAAEQMREGGDQPLKERESAANEASEGKKSAIQAQTLQQVLRAADANEDGVVTRREYGQAARKAYDDARRAEVGEPSLVALRRFVILVPEDSQGAQQDAQPAERQLQQMSRDEAAARSAMKFGALDRDGDDQLAESEWNAKATDMMSESLAEKHFEAMDENDDSKISREEYRSARSAGMGDAQEAVQAWDEPQTLTEGEQGDGQAAAGQQQGQRSKDQQAQGRQQGQQSKDQQSKDQQSKDQQSKDQQAEGQQQKSQQSGRQQEAAVPVYIFRFHTM